MTGSTIHTLRTALATLSVAAALAMTLSGTARAQEGALMAGDVSKEVSAAPATEQAAAPQALALGSAIPAASTKMKGVDGKEATIASVAGKKGTLVMFSCNACPWVKRWEDRIAKLGNEYSKKGVGVIVINSNDPSKNAEDGYDVMVERAKAKKFGFAYVVDGTSDVARAFGASRTPEGFLFDAQGKLVYHGAVDDNAESASAVKQAYLGNALAAVTSGKVVTVNETKAMGCSIKFRSKAS